MISFQVQDASGEIRTIEVPEGINLSLMEVLKASDYDIQATCGGMALCATCHIEVKDGLDRLASKTDAELDMLDTLPSGSKNSRLACQIKINEQLQNSFIKLSAPD
jgi:2Fe-2S ferredoxin